MTSQPVSSICLCSPLSSGIWEPRVCPFPDQWCYLPTSSSVCLFFFPFSLCLARWFRSDLACRFEDSCARNTSMHDALAFYPLDVSDELYHLSSQVLFCPWACAPHLSWNCRFWEASARRLHKHQLSLPPLGSVCWREKFHIFHLPLLYSTVQIFPAQCQCQKTMLERWF